MNMLQQVVWAERYRPSTITDCILPSATRKTLEQYIQDRQFPNLLFVGPAGIGKTTAAIVLVESVDSEYLKLNSRLYGSIDTLRNEIQQFASTVSWNGNKKYVILDEGDNMSAAMQEGLKGFIEEYSDACGFILTCNHRNRVLPEIISRLSEVSFMFPKDEKIELGRQLLRMTERILTDNSVTYELVDVQRRIVDYLKYNTDIRKFINQLQPACATGNLLKHSGNELDDQIFDQLVPALKNRKFADVRKWVGEHSDISPSAIFRYVYHNSEKFIAAPAKEPMLIHLIAEYDYRDGSRVDREINLAAFFVNVMKECV